MGWTGGYSSVKEIKNYILRDRGDGYKVLDTASTSYGRNMWVVYQHPNGKLFICLYLIQKHGGDYAYKDITESMGPCEVDCPLRMLEQVPTDGNYGAEWRLRVQAYHAKRSAAYAVGSEVLIYGKRYKVIGTIKRSYRVQSMDNGAVYKCGASKMVAA